MKLLLLLLAPLMVLNPAHASDLAECRAKIAEMISATPASENKGPTGNLDQYHMSKDQNCGIELTDEGYFTVNRIAKPKFETIILNHAELSAKDRVKAESTCTITEDAVYYTTRLPIFSDGVKSPFQVKKLAVTRNGSQVTVKLTSKILVLSSPIICTLN
jgi:hypothetical protein